MKQETTTWNQFLARLSAQDEALTTYRAQALVSDHDVYVAMSSLAANRTLSNLYFQGCECLTDKATVYLAVALASNNTLVHIDMRNTHITERGRTSLTNSRGSKWSCSVHGKEGQVFRWSSNVKRPETVKPRRLAWKADEDDGAKSSAMTFCNDLQIIRRLAADDPKKLTRLPRPNSASQLSKRPSFLGQLSECSTSATPTLGCRSVSDPGSPLSDNSPSSAQSAPSTPQQRNSPLPLMKAVISPKWENQPRGDLLTQGLRISQSLPVLVPNSQCSSQRTNAP